MRYEDDSSGIYDRGHGGYNETISAWRKQREGVAKRLDKFYKGIGALQAMIRIIERAKKRNPNNLPF